MKNVRGRCNALLGMATLLLSCGSASADTRIPGMPVDWQQPTQSVAANGAGKQHAVLGAQRAGQRHLGASGGQGGTAMLPGAAGPALGLVYHKTIKCLDKPRPPKHRC